MAEARRCRAKICRSLDRLRPDAAAPGRAGWRMFLFPRGGSSICGIQGRWMVWRSGPPTRHGDELADQRLQRIRRRSGFAFAMAPDVPMNGSHPRRMGICGRREVARTRSTFCAQRGKKCSRARGCADPVSIAESRFGRARKERAQEGAASWHIGCNSENPDIQGRGAQGTPRAEETACLARRSGRF